MGKARQALSGSKGAGRRAKRLPEISPAGAGLAALVGTAGVGYLAIKRNHNKAKLHLLSRTPSRQRNK
jgi:hypothetical protein